MSKSDDTINRQAAIDALNGQISVTGDINAKAVQNYIRMVNQRLHDLPSGELERTKDIIQKFHDYQIEWLTSHNDLELEPMLEEWIIRFLHDTANCYMMEVEE